MQQHIATVTHAVQALGHPRINPESLMALGDAIDREEVGDDVARSFRVVMHGFRALFAPL